MPALEVTTLTCEHSMYLSTLQLHVSTPTQSERDIVRCNIPTLIQDIIDFKTNIFEVLKNFSKNFPHDFGEKDQ